MVATRHVDVAIIGAGPAGCMAAAGVIAADPGLEVVIVEKVSGPRHRIGEALLTGTVMTLMDAGLADDVAEAGFHLKKGAAYVWGETRDTWYVNYPETGQDWHPGFAENGERRSIHVPRHEYDPILLAAVERKGARLVPSGAVGVDVVDAEDGPTVTGLTLADGSIIVAREYIDCSGQAAFLSRRLSSRTPVGAARTARYAYTDAIDWERAGAAGFDPHRTNIVSGEGGWFWVIHLGEAGEGLTSFGFVSTPDVTSRLTLENCTDAFPEARMFGFGDGGFREPKTFDGKAADRLYGHPDYSYATSELHGANWSMAGDAALFIDPILSQGVTLATHYGLLRGRAAAARLAGVPGVHAGVDLHYRREASVMREVVDQWYANNRSVAGWRMTAATRTAKQYGVDMAPVDAFRWITNLENIRDEYDPYPACERAEIGRRLGV